MVTLTYDYGKVTENIKVRLSVIVEEPKDLAIKKGPKIKVVDRSLYAGAEYFRVSPHPFITIDISSTRDKSDDARNPSLRVNINRMYKHIFAAMLKRFVSYYTENVGLFYYDEKGKLRLEDQKSFVEEVKLQNNNTIRLMPMVVYTDPEVGETACEGAFFMINSPDTSCTMTFTELDGFCNMMSNLDMDSMAIQLLSMYQSAPKDEFDQPTVTITPTFPTRKPVNEEKPVEPPSSNTPAHTTSTIPDL